MLQPSDWEKKNTDCILFGLTFDHILIYFFVFFISFIWLVYIWWTWRCLWMRRKCANHRRIYTWTNKKDFYFTINEIPSSVESLNVSCDQKNISKGLGVFKTNAAGKSQWRVSGKDVCCKGVAYSCTCWGNLSPHFRQSFLVFHYFIILSVGTRKFDFPCVYSQGSCL